ncbi:MAG: DinB family protein [Acidobacteria bacterium]|nr:DinB family protein [Acidobacteriota bacterium]
MQFKLDQAIEILSRTPLVLNALLNGLSSEWTSNNEGEQTWSPYDVVGHLIHGERTDWMPRLKIILQSGEDEAFPPFDRFAQFEESQGKTLAELLVIFAELRTQNLAALVALNLTAEDLQQGGTHPAFGSVRLEQLLATWVTHDLSHLSQITRTMAKQYTDAVGPWAEYLSVLKK